MDTTSAEAEAVHAEVSAVADARGTARIFVDRAERPRTTRTRKHRADAADAASSTSGAAAPVVTADGSRDDAA